MKYAVCIVSVCSLLGFSFGCTGKSPDVPERADPEAGRMLVEREGCGSCHHIPGVASAKGQVGPPLGRLARRAYLAGVLPNNFDNLVLWIQHPQRVAPRSAMPDLGLNQNEAEDITAFLYTLD